MDPISIAAAAVAVAGPFLLGLGKTAADGAAKAAGESVWKWITARLSSDGGKAAVEDFKQDPEAPENGQALQAALLKAFKAAPGAAAELEKLLPVDALKDAQSMTVIGNKNKSAQGQNSTIIIAEGPIPSIPKTP
jgi:hypothetical protein